jgi:methylase of polypeptide subunit release factors
MEPLKIEIYKNKFVESISRRKYNRFPNLTNTQKVQVEQQLLEHEHSTYKTDIDIDGDLVLHDFIVQENVMRPEIMSSKLLAQYLWSNKQLFSNKVVMDMGSGSGILGVIAGLAEAKSIIFSDVTDSAIANTLANIQQFSLSVNSHVLKGNLFEKVMQPVDIIIFNHPFFADHPITDLEVSISMLDPGRLIQSFFNQADKYCRELIIMPFFGLAGEINNPAIQCQKYGYTIYKQSNYEINSGLQLGQLSIYEILPPGR